MNREPLLANMLSNLQTELIVADYNCCGTEWRDLDYTPDYSKFYWIREGEGWLKIGNDEYAPIPGQLVLMPEGITQSYSAISDRPYLKYWCHFNLKAGGINLFQLLRFPHVVTVRDPERLDALFGDLLHHSRSDKVYAHMMAKSKLTELIAHFIEHIDLNDVSVLNMPAMEKMTAILAYIDAHIEENMTIQDLAGIACMHPNYFIRFFKQQLGVPPIQYITRKKMDKAKEQLIGSSSTITMIADQLGFGDLFYFSRQFKKHTGLTPTEYRRQHAVHAPL